MTRLKGDTSGFTSTEIVISPPAKGDAYDSTITYDHSSDLKTWAKLPARSRGGSGALDVGDDDPWLCRHRVHGLSPKGKANSYGGQIHPN